jgi:hypothetical protein
MRIKAHKTIKNTIFIFDLFHGINTLVFMKHLQLTFECNIQI